MHMSKSKTENKVSPIHVVSEMRKRVKVTFADCKSNEVTTAATGLCSRVEPSPYLVNVMKRNNRADNFI